MKKTVFPLFLSIWLAACNNNTPTGIASKFLDCLVAKDYDRAKQYCTVSGAMAIGFLESMNTGEAAFTGYKILRDSIVNDHAWVFYEGRVREQSTQAVIELSKIDGKWKIDPRMRK